MINKLTLPKRSASRDINVAVFIDGFILPPKEGINVHLYELGRSLYLSSSSVRPIFFICDRGLAKIRVLSQAPFDTVLIHPKFFYNPNYIRSLIKQYQIGLLQAFNPAYVVGVLGPISLSTKLPLLLEVHDLHRDIAKSFNRPKEEVAYQHRLQTKAMHYASKVRVMSKYDYYQLMQKCPNGIKEKLVWMPLAIDVNSAKSPDPDLKRLSVLFVGNTNYLPNRQSAEFIINEIAPRFSNRAITFLLIGRAGKQIKLLARSRPNIKCLGEVDDLNPVLSKATLALAPIWSGSGMKMKILSYLAAGLPVLATPIGRRGYPKSRAIVVKDTPKGYINALGRLLEKPSALKQLGQIGRKMAETHFNASRSQVRLTNLYQQLSYIQSQLGSDKGFKIIAHPSWLVEDHYQQIAPQTQSHIFISGKRC